MADITSYLVAVGIIIITLVLTKLMNFILRKIVHLSAKTKTQLDDIIIKSIKKPLRVIILTVGFFLAFKYIYPEFVIGPVNITSMFKVIWILVGAWLGTKLVNAFFLWYVEELQHKLKKKVDKTIFQFIKKIINIFVIIFAILAIINSFGINITPMLAGLGIGGIAIALALKDTLANFLAAIYITADRPMKLGDFIELDDKTGGYVQDIGWRTTKIRTWDGNFIIIPNAKISESLLRNYNAPKQDLTFSVKCGVAYDSDLDKVEKVSLAVAKQILKKEKNAIKNFEPFVRFKEFGDSSINFAVYLQVKSRADMFKIRHEFIKALHKRFNKEKIEIPFPQLDIHRRK